MKPLAIQAIVLTHFKNYPAARFELGGSFNLISGLNGVGKTNLLDALYYLCVGKSYFTHFDQRVVSQTESFFRLEGDILRDGTPHKVIIKVRPGFQKELFLDGIAAIRINEHLGFIPVVFSAPKDIDVVYGSSQSRRRYIDHLLCQIDQAYLHALVKYNYLLQMRNTALKQGFKDFKNVIATYDQQMTPLAALIHQKRKWLVEKLEPLLFETYTMLSENREEVDLNYRSQLHEYGYDVLADMNWEVDKNTMRTHSGIHKDDYELFIKNLSAKEYGSQGQVKSLLFALHLSKYAVLREQTGLKPLLILDDIFDKLDERRLHRLMEMLTSEEYGQVFISDTNSRRVSEFLPSGILHHIEMK